MKLLDSGFRTEGTGTSTIVSGGPSTGVSSMGSAVTERDAASSGAYVSGY